MLATNLLPPERKKLIEWEMTRRLSLFLALGFSLVFLAGAVLLLPSFVLLYFEERSLEDAAVLEKQASTDLRVDEVFSRAQAVRSALSLVSTAVSEGPRASKIIEEFSEDAGAAGITLTSLVSKKDGSITLVGIAPGRRDLLDFEKRLRDSGKFQEINYPLSSILPGTNIKFTFQGKLKPPHGL